MRLCDPSTRGVSPTLQIKRKAKIMIDRTRAVVVWHDAHAETSWTEFDAIDQEPCVVETCGWLLPEAKKGHVVVAQSITNEDGLDNVLCIPVGMVVSVRVM
jgi:hypothetical protein